MFEDPFAGPAMDPAPAPWAVARTTPRILAAHGAVPIMHPMPRPRALVALASHVRTRLQARPDARVGWGAPTPSRLRRLVGGAALVGALALGCGHNPERLPELDRRFYYNLPDPASQEEFLSLKKDQRQAYLERKGLWKQWTQLTEQQRRAVLEGKVEVGDPEFAMFMAWGPPADTRKQATKHRTVYFHTFIRCTSGPKVGRYVKSNLDCDGTSSETIAAVENGQVTEIKHPY